MYVAVRTLPVHEPVAYLAALQALRHPYLLESAGGPADISSTSYLGAEPFASFTARGREVVVQQDSGQARLHGDPLSLLQEWLGRCAGENPVAGEGAPPLAGAAVGYISYDAGRVIERLPTHAANDLGLPDICLHAYRWCIAAQGQEVRLYVRASEPGVEMGEGVERAEAEADRLAAWLKRELANTRMADEPLAECPPRVVARSFTQSSYEAAARRVLAYIGAGDVFQVNLAQRFSVAPAPSPLQFYTRLASQNPAPFAAYLDGGDFCIVSSSPERLLKVEPGADGLRVETRPIKGTRPRGQTPAETAANVADLLASEKDAAELAMIVDLQRNDLGRICRFGSVQVTSARRVEAYPTVLHTVATVEGVLRPEVGVGDLLRATLPGGSITGAPKVRAMEIIEELEPVRRGPYCGAIGYLGFNGGVDLNIAIRTVILRDGQAHLYAGGGIVADSDPAAEYAETLVKARALLAALAINALDPAPSQAAPAIWLCTSAAPPRWLPAEEAIAPLADRALQYGDGLFETIRLTQGRAAFLAEHWARLCSGAATLGFAAPCTAEQVAQAISAAARQEQITEGYARLTLSRGSGPRGYLPPATPAPWLTLQVAATPKTASQQRKGHRLAVCPHPVNERSPLTGLKRLGDLEKVLARTHAASQGATDSLLLNTRGEILETTSANLFWVEQGRLCTPPLDAGVLPGVTRTLILRHLPVQEVRADPTRLLAAEECFVTNVLTGVLPVLAIGEQQIAGPGPMTMQVQALVDRIFADSSGETIPYVLVGP